MADYNSQPNGIRDMATGQNIGQICLKEIASIWQVDDAAIEWVEQGFDWRPGSHLVRVRAFPNEKPGAQDRWRNTNELAHASFVPIALYSDGLATNFALWSVARVRWLRQTRWPNLEDKPMIEILENRYGPIAIRVIS
jgi:hypothetical protein